jgi:hypothetical protein
VRQPGPHHFICKGSPTTVVLILLPSMMRHERSHSQGGAASRCDHQIVVVVAVMIDSYCRCCCCCRCCCAYWGHEYGECGTCTRSLGGADLATSPPRPLDKENVDCIRSSRTRIVSRRGTSSTFKTRSSFMVVSGCFHHDDLVGATQTALKLGALWIMFSSLSMPLVFCNSRCRDRK